MEENTFQTKPNIIIQIQKPYLKVKTYVQIEKLHLKVTMLIQI